MGISFGESRHLTFLHPSSGQTFTFPQNNGDVFAFTSVANKMFQHGVPKPKGKCGPRISLIAWGCRRTLNVRNSGAEELLHQKVQPFEGDKPSYFVSTVQVREENQEDEEKPDMAVSDAIVLFQNWIANQNKNNNSNKLSNSGSKNNNNNNNNDNDARNYNSNSSQNQRGALSNSGNRTNTNNNNNNSNNSNNNNNNNNNNANNNANNANNNNTLSPPTKAPVKKSRVQGGWSK
jgi:hypothetical protein